MSATSNVQARLAEAQLEKELKTRTEEIARALYGPMGRHEDFGVVTCVRVESDPESRTTTTAYQAKCIGYRNGLGDEWELCNQSTAVHGTAREALDELLGAMRRVLEEATTEVTRGKWFRGISARH
ncbi:hypothetical protein DPSP01_010183 [Paraphaeosphaeria sporulosa]